MKVDAGTSDEQTVQWPLFKVVTIYRELCFFNFKNATLLPYFASPAILNPARENVDGFPVNECGDFPGYASSRSAPDFLA